MVEEGWTMEKGDVLLTGALGNMIPGKPGEYVYSIEPLGTVKFTVK
jgi:2-keto-4-pentenoate hydratase